MRELLTISLVFVLSFNKITAQDSIIEHKIQKGETAYFIAQKYKVSVEEIYKLNPESQNGIKDSQIIKIPVHSSEKTNSDQQITHIVGEKETLYGLSKQYHVSVEAIQNANQAILINGLQVGQELNIPNSSNLSKTETAGSSKVTHQVVAKESLFSIARQYNVSVQDLENLNKDILINGLQIGQTIAIPNKRKTLDGRVRVINQETVFHVVEPKETKFSISKKYGISIGQLESQNPEIVNGLIVGNKLAINTKEIKPANESEELMLALAEKQVVVEKTKAKTVEIEDLKDRLVVQKEMNQKIIKINDLKVNLNDMNGSKENSVEKLRLVLEANKNVQDVLMAKLDSLVNTMNNDLKELKRMDILNVDESKRLEKQSYESIGKTSELSSQLKKELAENRKAYAGLMNKVEKIAVEENQEYKKKIRESEKNNNVTSIQQRLSLEEIKRYKIEQEQGDAKNQLLISKIDSLDTQKQIEVKRHISKASYYSMEARKFDDKLALVKLKKYQDEAVKKSNGAETSKIVSLEEMRRELKENPLKNEKNIKIEVYDNLKEVSNGYYLVLGIFTDAVPRDKLIMQLIDSGNFNAGFFFNINSLSYYVYADKFQNMDEVLYQCKKKEEDELYKNIVITKLEIDLR
ncbi:lytic transglycosylase [Flavobacterium johnsoniae]|uniref:Peptidoglycan-binding LysM n=1 Tax=Flavobacterium johnsoniae (strain ATCC 17061 / DSM 2064 / JCM 8514 / BCRC 14874 / CCUG 350202 / NBRC 14942 / NCIMB 11054 / UW101) TaxID=376686 RepID=A5FHB5_FLAJ1|nr:LysM peptidoglycan-binding domain-containing protein [Flavobacterium johnsoniae]ABQ05405.1 Peptidoglycan-binding LysM [Flavobacterium johnsoniae UW101]OXE96855.1 peptidoglycan-binding protein [Flavobacterium johnsoniae UW101]WQG82791.1 LysM peptidoglycan-binding domain-containing protein [Flavobacterium johnsoniae UW101]SHL57821.1 LysM domain-containing protein [Flavobacterium johnsoniae]